MPASPQKTKASPEGNLAQLLAVLEANTTLLAFFFGLCFVAALLVLAIWFPQPTAFQYTVFRITLALAAAGIAGIIPGMIRLTVKPGTALLIHAGGALAVFVMVYLLAPASLQMEQPAPPFPLPQKEKPGMPEAVPPISNHTDTIKEIPSPPPLKEQPTPAGATIHPWKISNINAIDFGRFHALVIGNQNYRHLAKLGTPLDDAREVAKVLEQQYGFTVELLLDKTRDEIKLALSELRKTMTSEEDNLLIYYAGHGYLDEATGTGYWQPVDAEQDNDVYWISTDEITRLLRAIQAKHVLVVADSCYSGSLLTRDSGARLPTGVERDEWLRRMQARRSRTALTSGGEEPVADGSGSGHSVFAKVFLDVLRENRGILDGDSLFDKIKRPVILNAPQTPFYGDIRMADHEMGDFLLVPKELQGVKLQPQMGGTDSSFLQR